MGNSASSPIDEKDDWEGKFFTTSDGVKLSANVVNRLASGKDEDRKRQDEEQRQEARKEVDEKLNEMEQARIQHQMELERQREHNHQMMSEYDTMIGSRELQIHHLISELENERNKYADAVQARDERLTEICNSWNEKLGNKENEYKQLEDRLRDRETELVDVTSSLNEQIQAEKDKLSGYQDVFNERLLLMQDKFKFAVDGVVYELKQHQDQINHEYVGFTENLTGEKNKFENILERFAIRVDQQEDKLNGITGNFEETISTKVEKFQGVLDGFNQTVDQQNEKLNGITGDFENSLNTKVEEFQGVLEGFNQTVDQQNEKLNGITENFEDKLNNKVEKFQGVLESFNQTVAQQKEKLGHVTEDFNVKVDEAKSKLGQVAAAEDDLLAKVKNEQEKFSTVTSQLSEQIANKELKLSEVTSELTEQIKHEQEKNEGACKSENEQLNHTPDIPNEEACKSENEQLNHTLNIPYEETCNYDNEQLNHTTDIPNEGACNYDNEQLNHTLNISYEGICKSDNEQLNHTPDIPNEGICKSDNEQLNHTPDIPNEVACKSDNEQLNHTPDIPNEGICKSDNEQLNHTPDIPNEGISKSDNEQLNHITNISYKGTCKSDNEQLNHTPDIPNEGVCKSDNEQLNHTPDIPPDFHSDDKIQENPKPLFDCNHEYDDEEYDEDDQYQDVHQKFIKRNYRKSLKPQPTYLQKYDYDEFQQNPKQHFRTPRYQKFPPPSSHTSNETPKSHKFPPPSSHTSNESASSHRYPSSTHASNETPRSHRFPPPPTDTPNENFYKHQPHSSYKRKYDYDDFDQDQRQHFPSARSHRYPSPSSHASYERSRYLRTPPPSTHAPSENFYKPQQHSSYMQNHDYDNNYSIYYYTDDELQQDRKRTVTVPWASPSSPLHRGPQYLNKYEEDVESDDEFEPNHTTNIPKSYKPSQKSSQKPKYNNKNYIYLDDDEFKQDQNQIQTFSPPRTPTEPRIHPELRIERTRPTPSDSAEEFESDSDDEGQITAEESTHRGSLRGEDLFYFEPEESPKRRKPPKRRPKEEHNPCQLNASKHKEKPVNTRRRFPTAQPREKPSKHLRNSPPMQKYDYDRNDEFHLNQELNITTPKSRKNRRSAPSPITPEELPRPDASSPTPNDPEFYSKLREPRDHFCMRKDEQFIPHKHPQPNFAAAAAGPGEEFQSESDDEGQIMANDLPLSTPPPKRRPKSRKRNNSQPNWQSAISNDPDMPQELPRNSTDYRNKINNSNRITEDPNLVRNKKTFAEMMKDLNPQQYELPSRPCYSEKEHEPERLDPPMRRETPADFTQRPLARLRSGYRPPYYTDKETPEFLGPSRKPMECLTGLDKATILNDFENHPRTGKRRNMWWVSEALPTRDPDDEDYVTFQRNTINYYDDEARIDGDDLDENDMTGYTLMDEFQINPEDFRIMNPSLSLSDDLFYNQRPYRHADQWKYKMTKTSMKEKKVPSRTPAQVHKGGKADTDVKKLARKPKEAAKTPIAGNGGRVRAREGGSLANVTLVDVVSVETGKAVGVRKDEKGDSNNAEDVTDSPRSNDSPNKFGGAFKERQLDSISKVVYNEFESAANKVESKFKSSGFQSVCSTIQNHLLDCYKLNPGKPLSCNEELESLRQCVSKSKNDLWKN